MRQKLRNTFRNVTEDDLRVLFNEIETAGWKRKTETQYRKYSAARMRSSERSSGNFYKVVYGKGELPERIKWIKTKRITTLTYCHTPMNSHSSHIRVYKIFESIDYYIYSISCKFRIETIIHLYVKAKVAFIATIIPRIIGTEYHYALT